jgi:hypothetical protein
VIAPETPLRYELDSSGIGAISSGLNTARLVAEDGEGGAPA